MYLKKRAVRVVCAAMAAMILLSGCGTGGSTSGDASGDSQAAENTGGGGTRQNLCK